MTRHRPAVRTLLGAITLFLVIAAPARAQTPSPSRRALADSVTAWRLRNHLPAGLAVGVSVHGKTILAIGQGVMKLGSPRPVTERTLFHMASVTKPFVATAIMQLVDAGKIDIDQPVARYLPYFRMNDPRAAGITVKQVLNHTSGIPDVTDYRWDHPEYDDGALERYLRGLADSTLLFDPGTRFKYSNIGFELLAGVIAEVSGEPFEDYVRRHILAPLGMRHSTLLMTDVDSANLATGHVQDSAGATIVSAVYPYNRPHAASSTLHADVDDMLRWGNAWLPGGALGRTRVLGDASRARMLTESFDLTPRDREGYRRDGIPMPDDSTGVGLSWFLAWKRGEMRFYHNGGDTGFRSYLVIFPADSTVIVLMENNSGVGNLRELATMLHAMVVRR